MGGHEGWAQPNGFFPNGLLPDEAASVTRVLDLERWSRAEERTEELIACIQPNQPSEERRIAVANYVQRLMEKCFSCQVFTFGSVPLKTYLPDGDIDLTAFSKIQNLKDTWAKEVRDMLESEEKNDDAEFNVNEVQYIQAEVKIIKCLVENIVVDISFNQLGGLCTLCFLEEVDHLINQNHLFKRSIILIKAWCYYESRILGAHHGLISTYALETLVLYIFNVFNNSFAGPLEVLYRFLEFFSKFDWDNFCVSLWGPVPISSLPDMTADPPRKDGGELLLSKKFLNGCSSVYAVSPGGQETQEQPFISKHFNIIDPLRTSNNLGRSVSKGNFYRIRSAFSFGAKKLAKLLDCPIENLKSEFNHFFSNTLDRHGKGHRPDTPCLNSLLTKSDGSDSHRDYVNSKKAKENSTICESEVDATLASHVAPGVSSQQGNHFLKRMYRTDNVHAVSRAQSQKTYSNLNSFVAPDQNHQILSLGSNENTPSEKGRGSRQDYFMNEVHAKYRFARTHSSPELTDTSCEVQSQGRDNRASGTGSGQTASVSSDVSMMRNLGAEVLENHTATFSYAGPLSSRQTSSHQSIDAVLGSNSYYGESGISVMREDHPFVADMMQRHQEEQDRVNMMASAREYGFNAQVQMPVNLSSGHPPLPIAHSIASPVYDHRNSAGTLPMNFPSFQPPWVSNMHYSQGLVSWPVSQYIPSLGLASDQEGITEPVEDNLLIRDLNHEDVDHDFWTEQGADSVRSYDHDSGSFQAQHLEDRQQFTSAASSEHSSRASSSDSSSVKDHSSMTESIELIREKYADNTQYHRVRGTDAYSTAGSRSAPSSQATSSKTKQSSENSLDELSPKTSKSTRIGQGRKTDPSINPSAVYGLVKNGLKYEGELVDYVSSHADDDSQEWVPLSTVGTYVGDSEVSGTMAASRVRAPQPPGFELAAISGSNPVLPVAPLLGSDSRQRANSNQGVLPFAFYPTGPPVPFLTMVPVYNLLNETGSSSNSPNHFEWNEKLNDFHKSQSNHSLVSNENLDQSEIFHMYNSVKRFASAESPEEHKSDILNSDFASHWQNLQYARFCQNGQQHGSLLYSSPNVVSPMYLQGHVPWDGHGRPPSGNMNVLTQIMGCSPFIPESPLQLNSHRPVSVYQHYTDKIHRYRGGTGTYLPNPKISLRDRQSSNTRNHRGNYSYERKDQHGDREGNWNSNQKPRFAGRGQGRNQAAKPSMRMARSASSNNRSDKPWESFRHDTLTPYHSHSNSYNFPNSTNHGSANMAYSMYPLPVVNPSGVSSSGSDLPSVIMLYPYSQNISYGSHAESIEFGSLGPLHFSGTNEVSHLGEGSSRVVNEQHDLRGHSAHSSPDQPSSPQFQRSTVQRKNRQAPSSFSTESGR